MKYPNDYIPRSLRFRDLNIGDTFDFVSPNHMFNSFYARCTKISPRKYRWESSLSPATHLETCVGSISVFVYNVERKKEVA